MASTRVRRESSGCGCCALVHVSCSVLSAMYMYTAMCNAMYRAEVEVYVFTLIGLA